MVDHGDVSTIARMPRGGPKASWLNKFETDIAEYTDRYDIPDDLKQQVIDGLNEMGDRRGLHRENAERVLDLVIGIEHPRILELGAGHGKLSAHILSMHPTAHVTVSDLDPASVARIAAGPLGREARATAKVIDATDIDAADRSYDVVVFASSFHHLPPETAVKAIAEATRVGGQFLMVDLSRPPTVGLMLMPLVVLPIALVASTLLRSRRALLHDGVISVLRSYGKAAFVALGEAAGADITTRLLPSTANFPMQTTAVVFSRY